MCVCRSVWDGESNKHSDCQRDILKPVSLTVEIHRNLSADWYHGMPTLSIDAKLNPLLVRVISKMYTSVQLYLALPFYRLPTSLIYCLP